MQMTDMLVLVIIACSALLQLALANAAIDSQDEINGTAKNTGNILFLESPGGELGVLHAVEMAIEDVNNSPDVLPGYTLSLLCNSTEGTCSGNMTATVSSFFDGLLEQSPPLAVLGATTSFQDATLLAAITEYFSLNLEHPPFGHIPRHLQYIYRHTQTSAIQVLSISCSAKAVHVPNHFCMLPSAEHIVYGIAGFVAYFGWKRAAVITEIDSNTPFYLESDTTIVQMLEDSDVTVSKVLIKRGDNVSEMIFVSDVHIFIVNTNPNQARSILYEAFKQGMGYPNYVWIIPDWYTEQHLVENSSSQEKLDSKFGAVLISHHPINMEQSTVTVSGETYQELYTRYRMNTSSDLSPPYGLYAYDALWSIALALDRSNTSACSNGLPFEELVQCIRCNGKALQTEIERTNFTGISGSVSFDKGIRTLDHVRVLQYRRVDDMVVRKQVAHITKLSGVLQFVYVENESDVTVWPEGIPPDGTPIEMTNYLPVGLIVVLYVLAVGVIIFAVACMIFNFIFRKNKLIQLTSPRLNYVISVGTILMCITVFTYAFPPNLSMTAYAVLCPLRSWLSTVGYNLSFGTINAKMWRVYYIFRNDKIKKKTWKDWHLMVVVMVFVLIDVITLTVVTAVPESRDAPTLIRDKQNPSTNNEYNVRVDNYVIQCVAESDTYWYIPIYGYKLVVQMIGVILALLIRKVEVKGLNDAKAVQRLIYAITVVLVILIVDDLVLISINTIAYVTVFSLGLAGASIIILGFVFIPKMVGLYQDPRGDNVFRKISSSATIVMRDDVVSKLKERSQELEMHINTAAQQNRKSPESTVQFQVIK